MTRAHPLRRPANSLACVYLVAIALLGPLVGSSADASSAFTEHFDDGGNRLRDIVGSFALLLTAAMLVRTALAARRESRTQSDSSVSDLCTVAAIITSCTLVSAASLLLTVPLMTSFGAITGDPGIDPGVQAGIAQAGTVTLLVAALCLAVTTVLLARLGRQNQAVPGWIVATAWVTAAALCLGVTVGLLLPFAGWAVALGIVWSTSESL